MNTTTLNGHAPPGRITLPRFELRGPAMPLPRPARKLPRWPLFLIASPAAVAVWSGWVGLGGMCGFGPVHLLPGIVNSVQVNTAITLPVGVEAYGAYALGAWLTPGVPEQARRFARRSAIGALLLGMSGQVLYHLLAAAHAARAPWPVVVLVSCMPVVTLGFGAALTHLLRADRGTGTAIEPRAAVKAGKEAANDAAVSATTEAAAVPSAVPSRVPSAEPAAGPRTMPSREPRQKAGRLDKSPEADAARQAYRKSARDGQPLSDRALGEMFSRSRTWGSSRIREVERGPKLTARTG